MEFELWVGTTDDTNLNVVSRQLTLEAVFERKDGGVDRVLDVEVIGVALLEEALSGRGSSSERGCLPAVVGATCLDLEDLRTLVNVDSAGDEPKAERSDAAGLRVLLEELGDLLAEHEGRDALAVAGVV